MDKMEEPLFHRDFFEKKKKGLFQTHEVFFFSLSEKQRKKKICVRDVSGVDRRTSSTPTSVQLRHPSDVFFAPVLIRVSSKEEEGRWGVCVEGGVRWVPECRGCL